MDKIEILTQIGKIKVKLMQTDYKALKFSEGLITIEQYQPIKEQRQKWRDEINKLETQLKG